MKLENVKRENKTIEESIQQGKLLEKHQDSIIKSLQSKQKEEQERQEELEVQQYEQSVKTATLMEDHEKILTFIEEFIKRKQGIKGAKDNTVFRELGEQDRESINEMLKPSGLVYKEAF